MKSDVSQSQMKLTSIGEVTCFARLLLASELSSLDLFEPAVQQLLFVGFIANPEKERVDLY